MSKNKQFKDCIIIMDTISGLRNVVSATVFLLRKFLDNHIIVLIDDNKGNIEGATETIYRDPQLDQFSVRNVLNCIRGDKRFESFMWWDNDVFVESMNLRMITRCWNTFVSDKSIGHMRLNRVVDGKFSNYNKTLKICAKTNRWYISLWPCFMKYSFLKEIAKYRPTNPWRVETDVIKLARKSKHIAISPRSHCYVGANFIKRGGVTLGGLKIAQDNNLSFPGLRMCDKHLLKTIRLIKKNKFKEATRLLFLRKKFKRPRYAVKLQRIKNLLRRRRAYPAIEMIKTLAVKPIWK